MMQVFHAGDTREIRKGYAGDTQGIRGRYGGSSWKSSKGADRVKFFPVMEPESCMETSGKGIMHIRRSLVLLLFLVPLIIPAAPLTITAHPETIENGHPLLVTVTGLPDGARFSLLVEASYAVSPNTEFRFQMSQFEMPFSLRRGTITATLEGTSSNRLEVKKGDTMVTVSGKSPDGRFTTTKSYDVTAGTYDYFRLSGTTLPTARSITTQFQVTGIKEGPADSEIGFVIDGLPSGTITVAALVDGTEVLYETIPVGSEGVLSHPGTGNISGLSGSQEPVVLSSADGAVKARVPQGCRASIISLPLTGAPSGMRVLTGPYAVVPYETVVSPPAEIIISTGEKKPADNSTVAFFLDDRWTLLPSAVTGEGVVAPLVRGGVYALVIPEEAPPEKKVIPETPATPAASTVPVTKTGETAPTPQRTGLSPAPALLALCITLVATAAKTGLRPGPGT